MGDIVKEVPSEAITNASVKQKLSYEELEKYAIQASQQLQKIQQEYERINYANLHQRMAYLFEVVRDSEKFSTSFVNRCISEIEGVLTPEEKPDQEGG